jgi:hypothetical protein
MAKGKSGKEKQDNVYNEFQRVIRQSKYDGPTMVEQIIADSAAEKLIHAKRLEQKPPSVFISHYNPDNPLNGSSHWSKSQWEVYKAKVKADKVIANQLAKQQKIDEQKRENL